MDGIYNKKGAKNVVGINEVGNAIAPTNANGKKITRGPMNCIRCGEKVHKQASFKSSLNGTTKNWQILTFFV